MALQPILWGPTSSVPISLTFFCWTTAQAKKDEAAAKAAEAAARKAEAKRLAEKEEAELANLGKKKAPSKVKSPAAKVRV
jgi:hypothetical protein